MTAVALVAIGMLASTSTATPAAVDLRSAVGGATAPAPDIEAQFVSRINALRRSKGLSQLTVSSQVTGVARAWTDKMVDSGGISHNPNLAHEIEGAWTKAGENVGVGYSVDSLMQAFVDSPAHYRNLVDPAWSHLGVGVTLSPDGRIWTTHNFLALPEAAPAPAPPAPPVTTPRSTAPGPGRTATATPTTAAAATTTTVAPATAPEDTAPRATAERVGTTLVELRSLEGV